MRSTLRRLLEQEPELIVVGEKEDPQEKLLTTLRKVGGLSPRYVG